MKKDNTKDSNLFIHKREKASFHCLLSQLYFLFTISFQNYLSLSNIIEFQTLIKIFVFYPLHIMNHNCTHTTCN